MKPTIAISSFEWVTIFYEKAQMNAARARPAFRNRMSRRELDLIARSLPQWQRTEAAIGDPLRSLARKHASNLGDPALMSAVELYIREKQRQGAALGEWLDHFRIPRLVFDPKEREWEAFLSYPLWALLRGSREILAEIYYAALRRLTTCPRLQAECSQMLAEIRNQIHFHAEQIVVTRGTLSPLTRGLLRLRERVLYGGMSVAVWITHGELFREAGLPLRRFIRLAARRFRQMENRIEPEHYDFGRSAPYEQWRSRLEVVRP